jgi:hypothetical protein
VSLQELNLMKCVLTIVFCAVLYTGGTAVAKIVSAAAARHLTPVSLEVCQYFPIYLSRLVNVSTSSLEARVRLSSTLIVTSKPPRIDYCGAKWPMLARSVSPLTTSSSRELSRTNLSMRSKRRTF